jgi:branched-chain amino acid aminotransferase
MEILLENDVMVDRNILQDIDWDNLDFSLHPTRSMYIAKCEEGGEWQTGQLVSYGDIKISPAAGVLNYGQGVFEGIKVYRSSKDRIIFFRLDKNAIRFYRSCKRLCIPPIKVEMFIEAIEEVVKDNLDYVPPVGKGSLYIRPVAWGTGPVLGVNPAPSYTFLIFVSPVGPYFRDGVKPLTIRVTTKFHRAAPKGIGNAKAIGNYSASLYPRQLAKEGGFDEVIYLNASNENLVEEVGSANLFALKGNVLKTPRLAGSILPGVTRDSVIKIAQDILEIDVQETDLTLKEMLNADEVFCTGTAVVVTPIGKICTDNSEHIINNGVMGSITEKLRKIILNIQSETENDDFGWITALDV